MTTRIWGTLVCSLLWTLADGQTPTSLAGGTRGTATTPSTSAVPGPRLRPLESGVGASLRGLSIAADGTVWASGTGGTYLRRAASSASWRHGQVPGAEQLDFRDVQAIDGSTAFLLSAGRPGRIYKTENAGRTWILQYEDDREGVFFDAMAFFSAKRGVVFGDPMDGRFLVVTTEDGVHWSPSDPELMPLALPGEAGFAASGTALTVHGDRHAWFGTGGPSARVFRSDDAGRAWAVADTPILAGEPTRGIFSLGFSDSQRGYAVGGDYQKPDAAESNLAWTEDGGRSWALVPGAKLGGFREAVAPIPGSLGRWLSVGPNGLDWSTDGGLTWNSTPAEGLHTLAVAPDGSSAFVAGANGITLAAEWPQQ